MKSDCGKSLFDSAKCKLALDLLSSIKSELRRVLSSTTVLLAALLGLVIVRPPLLPVSGAEAGIFPGVDELVAAKPAGTKSGPASKTTPPGVEADSRPVKKTPAASPSGKSKVQALLQAADAIVLSGKFSDAEDKYRQALLEADRTQDGRERMSCLEALADCLSQENGKQAEEGALRQQSLAIAEKISGSNSPDYAAALAGYSGWQARKGEVEKALESTNKAMQILGGAEGMYPLEMADCYEATGQRQISQGVFGLADDSFKKVLSLRQGKLPDSDPKMIITCKEYADLLRQLDRKSEAIKLEQRITLARATAYSSSAPAKISGPVGTKSASSAAVSKNAGFAIFNKLMADARAASSSGDREAAISDTRLALAEAEKSGRKDGRLSYAMLHLGDLYAGAGKRDEARLLYKQALEIREQSGAARTLGMARNLERLANCAMQDKNMSEAAGLLKKALDIETEIAAPVSMQASNMQTLLSACMLQKDYSTAEQIAKRLAETADKLSGPAAETKKRMATAMLGSIYLQTGRQADGLRMLKTVAPQHHDNSAYTSAFQQEYEANEKVVDESEESGFSHS